MHFLKPGLRVEKSEDNALAFSCRRQIQPTARPLASDLWTDRRQQQWRTSACDRATEDIEPFLQLTHLVVECESQQQFDPIMVHTNDSGFLALTILVFFFLCSVSPSTVCLFTAHKLYVHAPSRLLHFLVNFLEYERQRVESFSVDLFGRKYSWNNAKEGGGKYCFGKCGHGLGLTVLPLPLASFFSTALTFNFWIFPACWSAVSIALAISWMPGSFNSFSCSTIPRRGMLEMNFSHFEIVWNCPCCPQIHMLLPTSLMCSQNSHGLSLCLFHLSKETGCFFEAQHFHSTCLLLRYSCHFLSFHPAWMRYSELEPELLLLSVFCAAK